MPNWISFAACAALVLVIWRCELVGAEAMKERRVGCSGNTAVELVVEGLVRKNATSERPRESLVLRLCPSLPLERRPSSPQWALQLLLHVYHRHHLRNSALHRLKIFPILYSSTSSFRHPLSSLTRHLLSVLSILTATNLTFPLRPVARYQRISKSKPYMARNFVAVAIVH